ncbi:MAG: hypothetical protein JWN45_2694 [Acidobacteriaceae bacterium]|nr:hypothetical protein [Acidobacteriaceae bacterium]
MHLRNIARLWLPPGLIRTAHRALNHLQPAPWEYVPDGWRNTSMNVRGWDVPTVVETQRKLLPEILRSVAGSNPLGIANKKLLSAQDLHVHNLYLSFAYVAALAARKGNPFTVLDWGGGVGHYSGIAEAVLPGVEIEYYCHDLPHLCSAGRELMPMAHFVSRNDCFVRKYQLVMASGSLCYEEDWRSLVDDLIDATENYLYITRTLFVPKADSFVVVQRPFLFDYGTEYLGWVFNRQEFLDHVFRRGAKLVREFLVSKGPLIHRAPQQGEYRGFLFKKN